MHYIGGWTASPILPSHLLFYSVCLFSSFNVFSTYLPWLWLYNDANEHRRMSRWQWRDSNWRQQYIHINHLITNCNYEYVCMNYEIQYKIQGKHFINVYLDCSKKIIESRKFLKSKCCVGWSVEHYKVWLHSNYETIDHFIFMCVCVRNLDACTNINAQ